MTVSEQTDASWTLGGLRPNWEALADMLGDSVLQILRERPVTITEHRWRDPRIIAIMMAARSLSNFRGAFVLLEAHLIVEARIMVRSLFEDAFWMAALATEGADFVADMLKDDARSSKLRGEIVLQASTGDDEADERIRGQLRSISERWPNAVLLKPQTVAETGPLKDFYVLYAQLSADSSHPTLSSLGRYMAPGSPGSEDVIEIVPEVREAELANTLDWACNAMLNVAGALDDILDSNSNETLIEAAKRYAELTRLTRTRYTGQWGRPAKKI